MKRGTPIDAEPENTATDCESGKRRYANLKDAKTTANHRTRGRQKRRQNRPTFLRPYPCPQCGGWHLTHKR